MAIIELGLLILAYTSLVLTIFVSYICYMRNLEKWETIAFAVSLLCLIVSISYPILTHSHPHTSSTGTIVLLAMTGVGLMTPLSVLSERQHRIPRSYTTVLWSVSVVLFLATCAAHFLGGMATLEYIVTIFLGLSVVLSMLLVLYTKPQKHIAHQEKHNRIFSTLFLILVPFSLVANYTLLSIGYKLAIGLTIPLGFILLSLSKLLDDLKRLSLIGSKIEANTQHYLNYQISEREKEIVELLLQGKTYKAISEELYISLSTVKSHASKIYKKCGVKNRNELTTLFIS